jgi:hypothetical protein
MRSLAVSLDFVARVQPHNRRRLASAYSGAMLHFATILSHRGNVGLTTGKPRENLGNSGNVG